MRLLSFSSASSPQSPVLTASNGGCMLPSVVVLHSEACFARQKRPREENSTPPKWPPRADNKSLRDSPHLVRLGQSMKLSRSPAAHHLCYGATFFPNSTRCALDGANITFKVQTSAKAESLRAFCAARNIAQRTRMRCRRLQKLMQPLMTQRVKALKRSRAMTESYYFYIARSRGDAKGVLSSAAKLVMTFGAICRGACER